MTCADDLKECIIEIDNFLADKKSMFVMTVHDELSFFIHPSEEWVVPKLKALMEADREWCYVPIISDVEVTTGSWRDKEGVEL